MALLAVRHQAQADLRAKEERLQQHRSQFTELAAEHSRLSNLLAHASASVSSASTAEHQTAELAKLRSKAEALQKQTNKLHKQLAANHELAVAQISETPAIPTTPEGRVHTVGLLSTIVSDSPSEEYHKQLYAMASDNGGTGDAKNLGWALRQYARANQGQLPVNFDAAAPYLYKDQPFPDISRFEFVYQGSLNDLSNIPKRAVALTRQRQAWQTPAGKLARIYTMADGTPYVVESSDNFQSWEAEHIIPSR